MDTGRIRMENYNGILYCEAYMDDEFMLSDLEAMRTEIRKNYAPSTDVILKKAGSYSVSAEAQITLLKGIPEFKNFVYVADKPLRRESADYAAKNYMKAYNTRVASTREQAYKMLQEDQDKK
jgi:uncharacterized protein (DUF1330 family)